MDKQKDTTMGGLDALVAAASSVSAGSKGQRAMGKSGQLNDQSMIDPALQNESGATITDDTVQAISALLSNPALVNIFAEHAARAQNSLYASLFAGSVPQQPIQPAVQQQTRYGRVSRPPIYAPPTPGRPLPDGEPQDVQIQAIKDALQNVSGQDGEHDQNAVQGDVDYSAIMDAAGLPSTGAGGTLANGDPMRFWKTTGSGQPSGSGGNPGYWMGDAETLAQAADASQAQAQGQQPAEYDDMFNPRSEAARNRLVKRRKRAAEEVEESEDDGGRSGSAPQQESTGHELPAWPLPPTGKGGRKNMPKEELLARRRARNRVAAQESRKKKKQYFGTIEERLQLKEEAYEDLQAHCNDLEQEVDNLRRTILAAGLELPPSAISVHTPQPSHDYSPPTQSSRAPKSRGPAPSSTPASNLPSHAPAPPSTVSFSETPRDTAELAFHDLFMLDDNDDNDADFVPASSPKRDDSDSDESDAEDDVEPAPRGRAAGKRGAAASSPSAEPEAEDEEEDLFLPIVDVPVPEVEREDSEKMMRDAMSALGVESPEQLVDVAKKMLETASHGGVTEEQVSMLGKLVTIAQAQGVIW
ncbi:hypothetical protein IAT38_000647 [Cryptococcus sp. DSM 104549]